MLVVMFIFNSRARKTWLNRKRRLKNAVKMVPGAWVRLRSGRFVDQDGEIAILETWWPRDYWDQRANFGRG